MQGARGRKCFIINDLSGALRTRMDAGFAGVKLFFANKNKNNRKKLLLFFGTVVFFNHEKEILHQCGNHRIRHSQQGHLRPRFYGLPFFHLHQPRWSLLQGCLQSR